VGGFFVVAIIGVGVGLAVGWLIRWSVRKTPDGFGQVALTLLGPYVAWVAAERLHASPVLACVAGGLYVRQYFSAEVSPLVRIQARSVWDLLIFLLNGIIFILIGLELGPLRRQLAPGMLGQVLWWGALITVTAIVVRLVWMPVGARLARIGRTYRAANPMPPFRGLFMSGWTAMRGVVSLATALALPLTTASGEPLPHRSEIILITFVVILGTLVVQGLTLAPLARALGLSGDDSALEEERRLARERSARAALERLDALAQEDWIPPSAVANSRAHYERRLQRFVPDAELDPSCTGDFAETQRRLRATAIAAERHELIRMRNRGEIGDEVLHEVERELDVEALRQGIGHVVSSPAP
jgi:CPA1 family monovalent cation:H+ antiporter